LFFASTVLFASTITFLWTYKSHFKSLITVQFNSANTRPAMSKLFVYLMPFVKYH